MGQAVGQSLRNGGVSATEPIRIRDLMSTITHTVFDVDQMRLQAGLPAEILQLTEMLIRRMAENHVGFSR